MYEFLPTLSFLDWEAFNIYLERGAHSACANVLLVLSPQRGTGFTDALALRQT